MHLYTKEGSTVIFKADCGHGSEAIVAQTFLVPGKSYTVQAIDKPNRWVLLKEWADHWWNIDMFDDIGDDSES
jgi:hypothetical protein